MEDCYFFLFSSCLKGSSCPFRHQESCKSNAVTCKNWQSAFGCTDPECSFSHSLYHLQKPRSLIPCYWEQNSFAGGCKKPDCPFMHRSKKDLSGFASNVSGSNYAVQPSNPPSAQSNDAQSSNIHNTHSNIPHCANLNNAHCANIHNTHSNTAQSSYSNTTFPAASKSKSPFPNSNSDNAAKKLPSSSSSSSSHPIDRLAFKRRKETVELKKTLTQTSTTDFQVKSLEQIMREKHSGSAGENKSVSISKANANVNASDKIGSINASSSTTSLGHPTNSSVHSNTATIPSREPSNYSVHSNTYNFY